MRGMDHYMLYGRIPLIHENPGRRRPQWEVPPEREAKYLFHHETSAILQEPNAPEPSSNCPALDALFAIRMRIPMWERAYRIKGFALINGQEQRLTVGGCTFRPAARGRQVPFHDEEQYLVDRQHVFSWQMQTVRAAIWLSHPNAHIYFHAFNDVVSQLVLAKKLGISSSVPVVLDAAFAQSAAGKYFLTTAFFRNRRVIVMQEGDFLRCFKLYMLQPRQQHREYLDQVAAECESVPPATPVGDRLVLVRDKGTSSERPCQGYDQLTQALVAKGYTAVDPATLSIPEQKWVFSRARHIVGENGSALTNIIFRAGRDLRIDALMASTCPSITFQGLSKVYGFHYHAHVLPSECQDDTYTSQLTPDVFQKILVIASQFQEEKE